MKKRALLVCLCFLVCCSRSGENPLPIEPLLPRAQYDLEASEFKIQVQSEGPHSQRIKMGADIWVFTKVCNVGLESVQTGSMAETLALNGKRVASGTFPNRPLGPGGCIKGVMVNRKTVAAGGWRFSPEEPGRYEFSYRVYLSSRYEEENTENNELVKVVEVVR